MAKTSLNIQEKLGTLTLISSTVVRMSGTNLIRLENVLYSISNPEINTANPNGIGGLDTGSWANELTYYMYFVKSGSSIGLVASLSSVAPTGFVMHRKCGAFWRGNGGTGILLIHPFNSSVDTEWQTYVPTIFGFGTTGSHDVWWRRIGTNFEFKGQFNTGTVEAVLARVTFVGGFRGDVSGPYNLNKLTGRWWHQTSAANTRKMGATLQGNGQDFFYFVSDDYTTAIAPSTILNGNVVAGSGNVVRFIHSAEIQGWLPFLDWNLY
jgi:hypothetical protein